MRTDFQQEKSGWDLILSIQVLSTHKNRARLELLLIVVRNTLALFMHAGKFDLDTEAEGQEQLDILPNICVIIADSL